jgi:hypothetical protein
VKKEGDIFEAKKEAYKPSEQRKSLPGRPTRRPWMTR